MTTLSLYSAADALAPLLDQIDFETGEMSEELAHALTVFEGKGAAVTAYILNMDRNAEMIRHAAEQMAKRAEPLERRAERLRTYLADNMKRTGITEIVANDQSFSAKLYLERDASVDVFDSIQVPLGFMAAPKISASMPDKKRIALAIKEGQTVPGARIVKRDRLVIA